MPGKRPFEWGVRSGECGVGSAMNYYFVPMNEVYAQEIVTHWVYGGEYAIHDYVHEADHMLDGTSWGKGLFAVLNDDGDLVGELTTEFFDADDVCVAYDDFNPQTLNAAEMWLGFGLKPALTGRGLGAAFVAACIDFAVRTHCYAGEAVRLGVPASNTRAIKVYQRVGFTIFNRVMGEVAGQTFEAVQMKKVLEKRP